jgi:uncharacterized protein (TIGR00730 family)
MGKLKKNSEYMKNIEGTAKASGKEITEGLKLLNSIKKPIVTVFGSHKVSCGNAYYKHCEELAFKLGKCGYAIMSGGGPGVMQAANTGAKRAGSVSIGVQEKLLADEQPVSPEIFTHLLSFHFLFVRRFILALKSEVLIFYPGGFGTLNELFEYLTLIQTGITDRVPIICVNRKYWKGLFGWIDEKLRKEDMLHEKVKDMGIVQFADSFEEIMRIIEHKSS